MIHIRVESNKITQVLHPVIVDLIKTARKKHLKLLMLHEKRLNKIKEVIARILAQILRI